MSITSKEGKQKGLPTLRDSVLAFLIERLTHWNVTRYRAVIINGAKNPHYAEVGNNITEAIIKTRAVKGTPATYWSQEEQTRNMDQAFVKWARKGTVWSAAASKVRLSSTEITTDHLLLLAGSRRTVKAPTERLLGKNPG